MNIGYIENVSEIGGAERMFEILFHGLRKTEFTPYLSCPGPGAFVETIRARQIAVEYRQLWQPGIVDPISTFRAWREWSQFIGNNNLQLLHTSNLHGGRSAIVAAAMRHIPVVCHMHFPLEDNYCRWIFKRLPKPAGFVFCSRELQEDTGNILRKYYPAAKQWVVHNGVKIEEFVPTTASNPTPRIGIIANLQKRKGHEDFLNMAAMLTQQGKKAVYDIIGGDVFQEPRQEYLRNYTKELGLTDRVIFHGQVSDVKALLAQLDIVICASHQEAFPVSILEAMACAKPVVSSNVNGIPEAIEDGKTGFLVPPHAPDALANAAAKLLDSPELRNEMGKNGRQRVEQYFSCDAYTAGITRIYRELLAH